MPMTNSEARKSREALERAPFLVAEEQRRREVMQAALAEVYAGASYVEADCLLDQLADRGASVEVTKA